jgi:hypothetical protein
MEALQQTALRNFEDEMVEHVRQFTPRRSEVLGEAGVRQVIQLAMSRAKEYGFTNRGPVRLYIDLVFMFGCDFDTDPQLPWAQAILTDPELPDQLSRAEQLHAQSIQYVEAVAGPNYQYAKEAFRRARRVRYEDLAAPVSDLQSAALAGMKAIHPEKCAYVGEPALRTLVYKGVEMARSHSVSTLAGARLFINLMFALGHGFATDPQYPWISNTLYNSAVSDPDKRAERLYAKTMVYLDHVLANLG